MRDDGLQKAEGTYVKHGQGADVPGLLAKTAPPCRVPPRFEPAFAGGNLLRGFALPEGYRIPAEESVPVSLGVGSKPGSAITGTAGLNILYHVSPERASRSGRHGQRRCTPTRPYGQPPVPPLVRCRPPPFLLQYGQ